MIRSIPKQVRKLSLRDLFFTLSSFAVAGVVYTWSARHGVWLFLALTMGVLGYLSFLVSDLIDPRELDQRDGMKGWASSILNLLGLLLCLIAFLAGIACIFTVFFSMWLLLP